MTPSSPRSVTARGTIKPAGQGGALNPHYLLLLWVGRACVREVRAGFRAMRRQASGHVIPNTGNARALPDLSDACLGSIY